MIGPTITVRKDCYSCECKKVEHYAVQGDSGCYVNCVHPAIGNRRIGNNNWKTPNWCPVGTREHRLIVVLQALVGEDSVALGRQLEQSNEAAALQADIRGLRMANDKLQSELAEAKHKPTDADIEAVIYSSGYMKADCNDVEWLKKFAKNILELRK